MAQNRADLGTTAGEAVRLHVEDSGSGPALLLMHGFSGSARNFRPQARSLASSHRVLLFDARGHARSAAPEAREDYSIDCFVADALRVLDDAEVERAVVGGLSMGAAVALELARNHPDRVRGLVLASFPPGPGPSGAGTARTLAFAASLEAEGLEAAGARFVWGPGSGLDARDAALVRQGFLEHSPQALAHILREMLAKLPDVGSQAAALASFTLPSLVLAGERDAPSLPPSRALVAALPRARLRVLADAGHVANLDQRAAFDAALREFLAGLEAGEGLKPDG